MKTKLYITAALLSMSLTSMAQSVLTVKAGGETTDLQLSDEPIMTIGDNVVVTAGATTLTYSKDQRVALITVKEKEEMVESGLPYSNKWDVEEYKALVKTYDSGTAYGDWNTSNPNYNQIVGVPDDVNGHKWYETSYTCNWDEMQAPLNSWCSNFGDIYVRRNFTYDDELPTDLYLACGHDDAPSEYYLNGELLWKVTDGWNEDEVRKLQPSQIALLKKGDKNVLAYHVHQNWGGMYADGGLTTNCTAYNIAEGEKFVIDEASVSLNGNESSSRIFDGKTDTKWGFGPTGDDYVIFHSKENITVNSYYFTTGNDNAQYAGRNPNVWSIYGADAVNTVGDWPDASSNTWQRLEVVTNDDVMQDVNMTTYSFPLDVQGKKYKYYMLIVDSAKGGGFCQFSEFGLSSEVVPDPSGIKEISVDAEGVSKYVQNGKVLIRKNGKTYNTVGAQMK